MNDLEYKMFMKRYEPFKDCNLPVSYWDEERQVLEFVYYEKEKNSNNLLNYNISNSLFESLSSIAFTGLYYSFDCGGFVEDDRGELIKVVGHNHAHSFEEVIRNLYAFPETFKISLEEEKYYSHQELEYLRRVQKYLLFIGLKDEDIPIYDSEGNRIFDYLRFNNKLQNKYNKCRIITCNESILNDINSEDKKYFMFVTEYPELYKEEDKMDDEALIVDQQDNFKFYIKYNFYKKSLYKNMKEIYPNDTLKDEDVVILEYFDVIEKY